MNRRRMGHLFWYAIAMHMVFSACAGEPVSAGEHSNLVLEEADAGDNEQLEEGGVYCGIASVFGALHAVGINRDFESLLSAKYVGSEDGSSASELMRAVRDNGAHVAALSGMTADTLRSIECPAILHTSGQLGRDSHRFDHWVLFLGTHSGKARVIDYPSDLDEVPFAALLSQWDGLGLIVSKEPISIPSLCARGFTGVAPIVSIVALIIFVFLCPFVVIVRRLSSHMPANPSCLVVLKCSSLAGFSLILSVLWHAIDVDGVLRNTRACRAIALAYYPATTPNIDVHDLIKEMKRNDIIVVDARLPDSYRAGCIPNAVNIPPTMTRASDRASALRHLRKDAKIVVYCQSRGCGYSDHVARKLFDDGYSNIRIFAGGWQEWQLADTGGRK